MRNFLPALLFIILAFTSCKKQSPPTPTPTVIPVTKKDTTTTGTTPQTTAPITISAISPSSGTAGTIVTIAGTNFGTNANSIAVSFGGKIGTIQSITSTEIKAVVPVTTSGPILLTSGPQVVGGPQFTYLLPIFAAPYVSGDVTLTTQAEVNLFSEVNKGKQLQIAGNLWVGDPNVYTRSSNITSVSGLSNITTVSGTISIIGTALTEASFLNTITSAGGIAIYQAGFSVLSFSNLQSFSGSLILYDLNNLSLINLKGLTTVKGISISSCPLLNDLSFLANITSAGSIAVSDVGTTAIVMDKLITTGTFSINKLNVISFKSLATVTGNMSISSCQQISVIDFSSLLSVSGKLTITNSNLSDLTGFSSLQTVGSLTVYSNPALVNFHGLEHLTTFTSPAIISNGSSYLTFRIGGVYITDNPKLGSLTGLQNVTSLPIAFVTGNTNLNDFCPLKLPFITLSKLPIYTFTYSSNSAGPQSTISRQISALTLANNSKYATTPDALAAVSLCK